MRKVLAMLGTVAAVTVLAAGPASATGSDVIDTGDILSNNTVLVHVPVWISDITSAIIGDAYHR